MDSMMEERVVLKSEEELRGFYEQIGQKFYEDMKCLEWGNNGLDEENFKELFASVKRIEDIQEASVLSQQGKKKCPECQAILAMESRFCNMCGAKLRNVMIMEKEEVLPNIRTYH